MSILTSLSTLFDATLRTSTPLILAALGGIYCERVGIINIALEGKMLIGAFTAATVTFLTQSAVLGFFAGGMAGVALAIFYGLLVLPGRSNQIVAGTGVNIFVAGLIPFLSQIIFQNTGSTPDIPLLYRFAVFPLLFAWLVVALTHFLFTYTPYGVWHAIAGEHPEALQSAGISVKKTRWSGVLLSGFWAGLGGATLSICLSSNYTRNMTAGRGFMALAAMIAGSWRPIPTALVCVGFGLFEALNINLQNVAPTQLIQTIPYVLTIIMVAGFVGKNRPPKALGKE